jgi:hypothetical protein
MLQQFRLHAVSHTMFPPGQSGEGLYGELTPKFWDQPVENRSQPMKMHENWSEAAAVSVHPIA